MTDGLPKPVLHLFADLRVDVDGVPTQVHADGTELVVETEHPVRLAQAALRGLPTGIGGSRELASRAGELLADEGVSMSLHGPSGRVATIGAEVDSTVGGAVFGSRRIRVALPTPAPRVLAAVLATAVAAWALRRSLAN